MRNVDPLGGQCGFLIGAITYPHSIEPSRIEPEGTVGRSAVEADIAYDREEFLSRLGKHQPYAKAHR